LGKLRTFKQTPGTLFERMVIEGLSSKCWGITTGKYLDQVDKIDVKSSWRRGKRNPVSIEAQVTKDANNFEKLRKFIEVQEGRVNGSVKVYIVVHDATSADRASELIDMMFVRDLLRRGAANKLLLLDISSNKGCGWADIYARKRELKAVLLKKLASKDRRPGTIDTHLGKAGCVIKSGSHRFFAVYSQLVEVELKKQFQRNELVKGIRVTFLPTKILQPRTPYFLAEAVVSA